MEENIADFCPVEQAEDRSLTMNTEAGAVGLENNQSLAEIWGIKSIERQLAEVNKLRLVTMLTLNFKQNSEIIA